MQIRYKTSSLKRGMKMNHEKSLIVLYCKCLLRISYLRKNIFLIMLTKRYAKAVFLAYLFELFIIKTRAQQKPVSLAADTHLPSPDKNYVFTTLYLSIHLIRFHCVSVIYHIVL